ncbi:MAG TPA: glycosyltransferase family 2 protein [Thermoanaerobaculia bacterium]|nr:glycosyltransferase family 2 protein [Thermoanaerobaculia bacterium]
MPRPSRLDFRWFRHDRETHGATVVMVTHNALEYTRACLTSLGDTDIVVVDNASTDGTLEFLRERGVHVIANEHNEGFPAAVNRGVDATHANVIVLLNNDTIVPPGTLTRLVRHALVPEIGIVVASTNYAGNESRVDIDYSSLDEMLAFAEKLAREHEGDRFDLGSATMYCVALRRDVFDRVGPLDERFTIGTFEDKDYSERIRRAGLRVVCAADAFVHHYGSASFEKIPQREYWELFERNQRLFEEKWKDT